MGLSSSAPFADAWPNHLASPRSIVLTELERRLQKRSRGELATSGQDGGPRRIPRHVVKPFLQAVLVLPLAGIGQAPDRARAWCEDVCFLARELERLHPRPFFALSREEFEAAITRFESRIESWDDERATAEFLRLVALVSRSGLDGHTAAWPMQVEYLPIQLYGFADGWFVVAASAEHEDLVRSRVLAIGRLPIDEVCERLAPFLSQDNEWSLRARMALALTLPSLMRGAGIVEGESIPLRLERGDGSTDERLLSGAQRSDARPWGGRFARSLPAAGGARWLEGRERPFHAEVLESERALYVQYNAVLPEDEAGRTVRDFAAEQVRTFEQRGLERLVLDLRSNAGGDSSTFGPLIDALKASPAINRRGALFALIGRATFSAGGNFVAALRKATQVLLVGEPMGGAPNHFGDAKELALPNHKGLFLRISTREHRYADVGQDERILIPDLAVALSSADYFAGRDPVMQRALEHREAR